MIKSGTGGLIGSTINLIPKTLIKTMKPKMLILVQEAQHERDERKEKL